VLRGHCEDVGRPYDDIERTIASSFAISPTGGGTRRAGKGRAEVLDHFGGLAEAGLQHVIFEPSHPWDEASLELIASIVPEVERLS
jgi:hypothetical protein